MPSLGPPSRRLFRSVHRPLPTQHYYGKFHSLLYPYQMSNQSVDGQLPKLQILPSQDEADIIAKLKRLISPDAELKTLWALAWDGAGVQRSFKFKTFNKTWVSLDRCLLSSNLQ